MPFPLLKLCPSAEAGSTDTDLLQRYTAARDQVAFTELVRRHGPLVYRVCRRLAPALADDAFQAVFLTLACRSGSIREPGAVGGWLVGVAGRIARQMRDTEKRRTEREREVGRSESSSEDRPDHTDLAVVLDDELSQLPSQLRAPVILCLVRGRTYAQAAAELGGSVRTLRRRLDRARAVLQARLERRGVVPMVAAALIAGVSTPTHAVPPGLLRKTVLSVFQFLDGGAMAPAFIPKGVAGNMAKIKASALAATAAVVLVYLGVGWSSEGQSPIPAVPLPPAGVAGGPTQPTQPPGAPPADELIVPPMEKQENVAEASFRGPNFVVHAPTAVMARVVAAEAEYHRRTFALKWLGQELPKWAEPCVIHVKKDLANGGMSTFTFGKDKAGEPALASAEMHLRGEFMQILTISLPHEVMHTVLASHFGKPLPRWADEGIALLAESDEELAVHDARVRELLNAGRGIRLKVLFRMTEYPKDLIVLYAQGHSLVRFLTNRPIPEGLPALKDLPVLGRLFQLPGEDGQRRLLAFIHLGMQDNTRESWTKAVKVVYGFESIDDLEDAWLAWLKKPESVLKPKAGYTPPPRKERPNGEDLIPPAKLPSHQP